MKNEGMFIEFGSRGEVEMELREYKDYEIEKEWLKIYEENLNYIIEEDWYKGEGGLDLLNIYLGYYVNCLVLSDECCRYFVKKNNIKKEEWEKVLKYYNCGDDFDMRNDGELEKFLLDLLI